jgi:hypothetical protein
VKNIRNFCGVPATAFQSFTGGAAASSRHECARDDTDFVAEHVGAVEKLKRILFVLEYPRVHVVCAHISPDRKHVKVRFSSDDKACVEIIFPSLVITVRRHNHPSGVLHEISRIP